MDESTVTDKGQVTIPKRIREKVGLEKGSKISFRVRDEEIVLVPRTEEPLEELSKMKDSVSFSDKEIEYMIKDSKESWSKHR